MKILIILALSISAFAADAPPAPATIPAPLELKFERDQRLLLENENAALRLAVSHSELLASVNAALAEIKAACPTVAQPDRTKGLTCPTPAAPKETIKQ